MKRMIFYMIVIGLGVLILVLAPKSKAMDVDGAWHDLKPYVAQFKSELHKDVTHAAHVDKINKPKTQKKHKVTKKDLQKLSPLYTVPFKEKNELFYYFEFTN